MKKIIKLEKSKVLITGNCRWVEIQYENDEEGTPYFIYKGQKEYLNDFLKISSHYVKYSKDFQEYHGIKNWTAFNGLLIKISDCGDMVQVFYFHC